MRLLAVIAFVVGVSVAHAQPGPDSAPVAPAAPPVTAPVAPPSATPQGVMANRWAIDVGLGLQSLNTTASAIGFISYDLSVRFRIIRPLEVALVFGAGANHADQYDALWVDARYNFMAERPWNIYVHLGLGGGAAAAKNPTEGDGSGRATLRLGVGLERRFDVFSISAEVRALTFGRNNSASQIGIETPESDLAANSATGIGFVVGSTYYF